METTRIENWEIIHKRSPYDAPEVYKGYLVGNVYGHPEFKDGQLVTTSCILETEENRVKTQSRWYELGVPSNNYEEWCAKHHPHVNLKKPFTTKKK